MKRFTLAAATALMLAGPLATTAAAQTHSRSDSRGNDNDRRGDRRDDAQRDGNRNDDRRDGDRRGDWNDENDDRRDGRGRNGRRQQHWDNGRHNGYTYNGRWNYGPAPAAYEGRNGYQAGYRTWRRGDRLPSYYQQRYRTVDYRREHLRAPPRGYRYVEDDRGDMLLVGIATGVSLAILLSQ
jgi:Ni/Co efflux regulator RcnB